MFYEYCEHPSPHTGLVNPFRIIAHNYPAVSILSDAAKWTVKIRIYGVDSFVTLTQFVEVVQVNKTVFNQWLYV